MAKKVQADLFSVFSDLEGNTIEFGRVQDLIQVYQEFLEDEIESLHRSRDPYTQHFLVRFRLLLAQLDSIQIHTKNILAEMAIAVDAGYNICKEIESSPAYA